MDSVPQLESLLSCPPHSQFGFAPKNVTSVWAVIHAELVGSSKHDPRFSAFIGLQQDCVVLATTESEADTEFF